MNNAPHLDDTVLFFPICFSPEAEKRNIMIIERVHPSLLRVPVLHDVSHFCVFGFFLNKREKRSSKERKRDRNVNVPEIYLSTGETKLIEGFLFIAV